MKSLFVCLALAGLPVFGGQQGSTSAPIALYTHFQQIPSAPIFEAIQSELQSIMTLLGLNFQWRDLASPGQEPSPELAVLDFVGHCDVEDQPMHTTSGSLGWTHITNGVIIPFADIDCDAVKTFLQRELAVQKPQARSAVLGRALGRVVAHELYHILAKTKQHGADGVARECYSVKDLIAPTFRFEERESLALRESQSHTVPPTAAEDVDSSPNGSDRR